MSLRDSALNLQSLLQSNQEGRYVDQFVAVINPVSFETLLPKYLHLANIYKKLLESTWDKRFSTKQFEVRYTYPKRPDLTPPQSVVITEMNYMLHKLHSLHEDRVTFGFDKIYAEVIHVLCLNNPCMRPLISPNQIEVDLR